MAHFSQLDTDLTEARHLLSDHGRPNDGQKLSQRLTLAKLISEAERLAASGLLPEQDEMKLRILANDACVAFGFDSVCERSQPLSFSPRDELFAAQDFAADAARQSNGEA